MSFNKLTPAELKNLGATRAEEAIRDLILAELRFLKVPVIRLKASTNVTAADGGVDARISCKADEIKGGRGIIPNPITRYQVKSGETGLTKGGAEEMLLTNAGEIKPLIKECLDKGGELVLCLFANDTPETKAENDGLTHFYAVLKKAYGNECKGRIHLWQTGELSNVFACVPALTWDIKQRQEWPLYTFSHWSKDDPEMRRPFAGNEAQENKINQLRSAIESNKTGPQHIRVLGEPGVGKTRSVYEGISSKELQQDVLFAKHPVHVEQSTGFLTALQHGTDFSLTVIIDECNEERAQGLWERLKGVSFALNLITIYNEPSVSEQSSIRKQESIDSAALQAEEVKYLNLSPLRPDPIIKILTAVGMPEPEAKKIADFCEGSPRAANIFAESFLKNPGDFATDALSPKSLWKRYVALEAQLDSEETKNREQVLCYLAAFKKFGITGKHKAEAEAIYAAMNAISANMSIEDFHKIIGKFRDRKILQGEETLYITPKALHLRYWDEFWTRYKDRFDFEKHFDPLPAFLQEGMIEMIQYARSSPAGTKVADFLLGPDGPFHKKKGFIFSEDGGSFLSTLCKVKPRETARLLEWSYSSLTREELLTIRRRPHIHCLERLLLYGETFEAAAKILFKLADTENESWGNNATGIFKQAFYTFSQSGVLFEDRLKVFLSIWRDHKANPDQLNLLIDVLIDIMQTQHSYMIVQETELADIPLKTTPRTHQYLFESHDLIWRTAVSLVKELSQEPQKKLATGIADHLRAYVNLERLKDIREFHAQGWIDKGKLISEISTILHFDSDKGRNPEIFKELTVFLQELEGDSFKSRMERFVKFRIFEDSLNYDDPNSKLKGAIAHLADEIIQEPALLKDELSWLTTPAAENAGLLGNALGVRDSQGKLWKSIREGQKSSQENASVFFIGMYLGAIKHQDTKLYRRMVTELIKKRPDLLPQMAEIVWRAAPDNWDAEIITKYIEGGEISYQSLNLMMFGQAAKPLKPSLISRWIDLLDTKDDGGSIAAGVAFHYFHSNPEKLSTNKQIAIKALSHKSFYSSQGLEYRNNTMVSYYWGQLAETLLNLRSSSTDILFERGMAAFEVDGSLFNDQYNSSVFGFFTTYLQKWPQKAWTVIVNILKKDDKESIFGSNYHIGHWLSGLSSVNTAASSGDAPITNIPYRLIKSWIDEDPAERPWQFAYYMLKPLDQYEEGELLSNTSLVARFVKDYGDQDIVRQHLVISGYPQVWSGPESEMLTNKITKLKETLLKAREKNLRKALETWIASCESRRLEAIKYEERRDYN